jgi:hypothetical protein
VSGHRRSHGELDAGRDGSGRHAIEPQAARVSLSANGNPHREPLPRPLMLVVVDDLGRPRRAQCCCQEARRWRSIAGVDRLRRSVSSDSRRSASRRAMTEFGGRVSRTADRAAARREARVRRAELRLFKAARAYAAKFERNSGAPLLRARGCGLAQRPRPGRQPASSPRPRPRAATATAAAAAIEGRGTNRPGQRARKRR